jgi:bifunctional DNA-binding transcriptional regulator/antitoxin component of YhaV-PrlF toxin-antitoxin module
MSESERQTITFSKKVDEKGRLVIPQEHRQALSIKDREALVEFTAKKVTYLDEDDDPDGGDS